MIKNNLLIEKYRITSGPLSSNESYGNNGAFLIKRNISTDIKIIASDGAGWEHVSVSLKNRIPLWQEMCLVKDLFWARDEIVIQYHPAEKDYINNCKNCLHLWKPIGQVMPIPPEILVGLR